VHRYIFFHTCRRGLEVLGLRVLWMSFHHPFLRITAQQIGPMQVLHKDLCLVILIFGGWAHVHIYLVGPFRHVAKG
jgi:hypothetical protein